MTDASTRQVLFSNQMLPIEKNLRNILSHYDKYGFGGGFDLTKPKKLGEYSTKVNYARYEDVSC